MELFNWVFNMVVLAVSTIAFSGGLFFILMLVFMAKDVFKK